MEIAETKKTKRVWRKSSRNGEHKFLWEKAKERISVPSWQKGIAWETTGKRQQSSYLLMQIV